MVYKGHAISHSLVAQTSESLRELVGLSREEFIILGVAFLWICLRTVWRVPGHVP